MRASQLGFAMVGSVLVVAGAPAPALADIVTFDFESFPTTSGGSLTTLTLTAGGLTATLTRPGSRFDIGNQFGNDGFPASWGTRTLDPFVDPLSPTPFVMNFSQLITQLAIDMGDFGGDVDVLTIQLFSGANGTGSLLGSSSLTLPASGTFTFLTPTASAPAGAASAIFIGGSTAFPNSVYYDNIRATFNAATTATPEPASIVLFATGLASVGLVARRRRSLT